ncbi:hypothetical protein B0J13DRAFT_535477 [Dactylonectria estremocensis]|uniref:DUF5071 domain-containing protein n=1 Tax=Dactylonectria estremocensis TaxID=1079267 RepID=A0A9P9JE69_9HYPO|nr:hypothetical protein B0J13DRAFT_535477 [Dactylonectria estremocensis]
MWTRAVQVLTRRMTPKVPLRGSIQCIKAQQQAASLDCSSSSRNPTKLHTMADQSTPIRGSTQQIDNLATLDANAFAARVPAILSAASRRTFKERRQDSPFPDVEILQSRATEPQTIAAIEAIMQSPLVDQDAFYVSWTAFNDVVFKLPTEAMKFYRPALEFLSARELSDDGTAAEYYAAARNLRQGSKDLLRYLDDPDAVWVPKTKFDGVGELSLQQRVTTAEQMRPHVPGLLGWLADGNWPPFSGCRAQLARFPEVTAEPIRALMEEQRGDGGWLLGLLEFVEECVPVGPLWEGLRPVVQAMVDEPKGDEDDWELSDCARRWLAALDAWKGT